MTWIVMIDNGLPRSLTKCFVFMTRTCFATIWHIFCVRFDNGLPRSVMCHFNVETLTVFRWTCVGFTRFDNGLPRSLWRDSLFVKKNYLGLLGTGHFSSILHVSRVSSDNGLPRSVTTWVWNWLVRLETSRLFHNLSFWSLSMFWTQFSFPFVFQGDLWWRPRWHVYFFVYDLCTVSILTTFGIQYFWKCFVKNDSVRSRLIELQSFSYSKIDVDPIFPCFVHTLCMTRLTQVDRIRTLMTLVSGIHSEKEHCLSVVQILTSRYQSRIDDGM